MLLALGNPERRFAGVLIAGTNGKGSTAATLASILGAAGCKTGLYSSPHLIRINERIRVNREEISDDEVSQRMDGGQVVVARCHSTTPIFLYFFQEGSNPIGREVFNPEPNRSAS